MIAGGIPGIMARYNVEMERLQQLNTARSLIESLISMAAKTSHLSHCSGGELKNFYNAEPRIQIWQHDDKITINAAGYLSSMIV